MRTSIPALAFAAAWLALAAPASADVISITQAKATAGNVTPGDTAGFPVTISQSGSFRLDSNLTVSANQIGLQITAPNVTVDLNGFTLQGSGVAATGVFGNSAAESVTIENGVVTRFKQDGFVTLNSRWVIKDAQITKNGRYGIKSLYYLRALNNSVIENGSDGIRSERGAFIQGNVVSENKGTGVSVYSSTVLGNTITNNSSYGLTGQGSTGFGNNTISFNNFSDSAYGDQVQAVQPLQPNVCVPAC